MNGRLKQALIEQQIKRQLKIKISEHKRNLLNEEASLYTTFVQPFTDVIQAVNLGAQDFLNSYITHLRMYITWDPKKGEELLKKHDERRAKIAEKWKPLMERTDKALSSGDADIVALAFAPQVFAVSYLGETVSEYSDEIGGFLDSAGLGGFVGALVPGMDPADKKEAPDDDSSLLDKLSTLFFVGVAATTAAEEIGKRKSESKEKMPILSENKETGDFEKDFDNFIDTTGVADELDQTGDDAFELMKSSVEEFSKTLDSREELFNSIKTSQNLSDFIGAFENADAGDLNEQESTSRNPQKIKKDLDAAVEKLASSEEFVEKTKEESGRKEISQKDLKTAAEKVVFLDAKNNFEKEVGGLDQALAEFAKKIGEQVNDILPTEVGENILKKSKNSKSKEVLEFIEKTKQKYFLT